jgi:DNA polymerase I-like protein with 3'-5' exonuclease and polymerase domains
MHESQRLSDPAFREQVEFLLRCPYIRLKGANFKYDLHWLWKRGAFNCTNFVFDTTIVGSLLDENRSNALDVHTKIYVPALAGYCVTPETRLLTADMQWVKAEEIQVNDELVGFEEESQFKRRRQLDVAKVTAIQALEKRCYRLTMKSGRSLTVSDNHQFLHVRDVYGGKIEWIQTEEIAVGMRLKTFPMRQFDESFDSGWMSGILDGEGWGSRSKTPTGTSYKIGWAQKKGKVLTRSLTLAAHWGLKFSAGSQEIKTPSVTLFSWDGFELLQLTRPVRLVSQRKWVKTPLPTRNRDDEDVVVSKELVGKQEVLAITTTTHTFIAEGMCSHNSDQFDREVDKSRMDRVPPDQLLPYAGGDVDADLQVAEAMKQELLQDTRLTSFYVNILHPAARAFEQIEQGGILVDMDAYQELKLDLEKEHARLVQEASKIMGGRIVIKHGYASLTQGRPEAMNLTKASMLVDFMFSPMGLNLKPKMFTPKPDKDGIQRPSTAMEHLEMFADDPKAKDFIQIIKTDSSVMKTYNTYVIGFLEHLRSDGRLHPTYYLFVGNQEEGEGGARTGRLSCKAPAFQTVPKHTTWAQRIRRCFPAPPGYVVVERDYGQGELRVIACIANETGMINVFKSGRDIHADTAAPFAGYTYESLMALEKTDYHTFEETRQLGKAGNFGLVFGMYEDGFVAYARSNYGVELTWDEAHTFRTGFFKKYPRLIDYHKSSVQFAKLHKHVRTPLGRIRHLPLIKSPNRDVASKAERQAINSPVQGCLTDMGLWTIALEHRSGLAATAPCWGACHDSILNYVPEDKVDVLVPQMLDQMEQLPFHKVGWSPQLTFVADAKVGKNWGELKKFKRPLDK